jgi:hypothetical protein
MQHVIGAFVISAFRPFGVHSRLLSSPSSRHSRRSLGAGLLGGRFAAVCRVPGYRLPGRPTVVSLDLILEPFLIYDLLQSREVRVPLSGRTQ